MCFCAYGCAGSTEAREAYIPYKVDPTRKPQRAREHGIGVGEGRFKGRTEAQEQFPGHKPPPAASRPSEKYEPSNLRFMGKTTAGDAFVANPIEKRVAYKPPARSKVSGVPFEAKSE